MRHTAGRSRTAVSLAIALIVVATSALTTGPALAEEPPPSRPNEQFVESLFGDLIDWSPTSSVSAGVAAYIYGGLTRPDLINVLVSSPEYRTFLADRLVRAYLGRGPYSAELTVIADLLGRGWTIEHVIAAILGLDEYYAAHGSTADSFVTTVYQHVLGRVPDGATIASWRTQLAGGLPRALVAWTLLTGSEYRNAQVEVLYRRILGRPSDPGGKATWVGELMKGTRDETVLAAFLASDEYFSRLPAVREARLAFTLANVFHSPDGGVGRSIGGIATMAQDGSDRKVLVTDTTATSPRWSPDGRFVTFLSIATPLAETLVIGADGGTPAKLLDGSGAIWSPDGTRLAWSGSESGGRAIVVQQIDTSGPLPVLVEGTKTAIPALAGPMAWSPDGTTIAYMGSDADPFNHQASDIWTVPATGGTPKKVTSGMDAQLPPFAPPAWSPDGRYLAFVARASSTENAHAWIVDADGRNLRRALPSTPFDFALSWSPVVNHLAVIGGGTGAIDVIGSDGRLVQYLQVPGSAWIETPTWSADGKRLFYLGLVPDPAAGPPATELFSIVVDGTDVRRLTTDQAVFTQPVAWPQ